MIHNLFLAVLPDEATARRLADLSARLETELGLTGLRLPPERLHVSMYGLGRHPGGDAPPAGVVDRVKAMAERVVMRPFDVQFDHVAGFGADGRTLVLLGGEKASGLLELRAELVRVFGPAPKRPFEPHITLMYADQPVAEADVEPVSFRVEELVLIDSLRGRGSHLRLHRRPLRG